MWFSLVLAAMLAGGMNALAGGGTLLTYPSLLAFGVTPVAANATSTVALVPGGLAPSGASVTTSPATVASC